MTARMAICLFEDVFTDFNLAELITGQPLKPTALNNPDPDVLLLVKETNSITPDWVDIIQAFSVLRSADVMTASAGAVLLIRIKKRIIACCFGNVTANINKNNIITDFGLAVAYKRIPKQRYKGIETFALSENPIVNNRSAALPTGQNYFNLDTYLETITELSGKYFTASRQVVIKGKEFFSVPAFPGLTAIKTFCEGVINDYDIAVKDPKYKALTAVSKVKETRLVDYLNAELCKKLDKREDNIHLVDYQHYENLGSYELTTRTKKKSSIEITDLYESLQKGHKFSLVFLKTRRITLYDTNNTELDQWSLHKCLFTQIQVGSGGHIIGNYILYKGNWYQIQDRYLSDLKKFMQQYIVDGSHLNLPPWNKTDDEGTYNKAASIATNGQCWDKILYKHSDFNYGIEFSDVLLPTHVMHVKKLGGSSLNSHLLMQTFVSAQLLQADINFRKWIYTESKSRFKKNLLVNTNTSLKQDPEYLVVLMSGKANKKLIDILPFFSLITFNMIIRRMGQLGYSVHITHV